MALYDANRNTSKATNYPNHMQRPMMFNKDAGQQRIMGHFASHNSQRYVFSTHEEVVKYDREDDRTLLGAQPRNPTLSLPNYMDHGAGDKSPYTPRSSTEKSDTLSPKLHHPDVINSPTKGSIRPESSLKDKTSPPPRNHHYYNTNERGKYNNLSSNDDKSEEENYKMDAKPKEIKRNGYAPPANYTIPYNLNNETPDSVNNVSVPPKVKNIPQIKTRIGDPDFGKENMKKTTNYNASSKTGQGYQEVINSLEARRRYSGGPSTRAGQYAEEMYDGIIDCIEAARKYNGVFVPK